MQSCEFNKLTVVDQPANVMCNLGRMKYQPVGLPMNIDMKDWEGNLKSLPVAENLTYLPQVLWSGWIHCHKKTWISCPGFSHRKLSKFEYLTKRTVLRLTK